MSLQEMKTSAKVTKATKTMVFQCLENLCVSCLSQQLKQLGLELETVFLREGWGEGRRGGGVQNPRLEV